MIMNINIKDKNGNVLITLIFFLSIAITLVTAAISIAIINFQGHESYREGNDAYFIAESGANNALLKLVRSGVGNYTNDTLSIDGGTATITVSETSNNGKQEVIITSVGSYYGSQKTIQVSSYYDHTNVLKILNWEEI